MSRVNIQGNDLVITLQGARQFFASPSPFKITSEISVPLDNVVAVSSGLAWKELPGLLDKRSAGTNLDQFYYGGVFVQDGDKVFFDLKKKEEAVVITLKDEKFERIVIGVDDPDAAIELIESALKQK